MNLALLLSQCWGLSLITFHYEPKIGMTFKRKDQKCIYVKKNKNKKKKRQKSLANSFINFNNEKGEAERKDCWMREDKDERR